jgi:hypothetical protein
MYIWTNVMFSYRHVLHVLCVLHVYVFTHTDRDAHTRTFACIQASYAHVHVRTCMHPRARRCSSEHGCQCAQSLCTFRIHLYLTQMIIRAHMHTKPCVKGMHKAASHHIHSQVLLYETLPGNWQDLCTHTHTHIHARASRSNTD